MIDGYDHAKAAMRRVNDWLAEGDLKFVRMLTLIGPDAEGRNRLIWDGSTIDAEKPLSQILWQSDR